MKINKITVGILTYNRKDAVLKAIQSVYDQIGLENYDIEIVVVDGASSDNTVESIKKEFNDVKLICLPRNLGCPDGRNHIYANSSGDIIVNLDDDGYFEKDAINKIVEVFENNDNVGVVAFTQRFTGDENEERVPGDTIRDISLFSGGVSAFSSEALKRAGYYPHDFFLFAEETYLSLKFLDAGYRIVSQPEAVMWHPKVGSSNTKRWAYQRYRNHFLVIARLYPGLLLVKYLSFRLISDFRWSIIKGVFFSYLRAVIYVIISLPYILAIRKPCKPSTIKKYYELDFPFYNKPVGNTDE